MVAKTPMTIEQFLQLPDEESCVHELWQGELVLLGDTTFGHNWIRERLVFLIKLFLQNSGIGGEALAETAVQFDSNTLARPDLSYWDAHHLPAVDWNRSPVQITPQLLGEVVSPSNSLRKLFKNVDYYLRSGVQVVWILDRDPFEVHVFEIGKAKRNVRPGEILEAPSVLPGFSVDVSRLVPPA